MVERPKCNKTTVDWARSPEQGCVKRLYKFNPSKLNRVKK